MGMPASPLDLTPGAVVRCAQGMTALAAATMAAGYVSGTMTVETAATGAVVLCVSLLLAFPHHRSAQLFGAAAIWLTCAEFMATFSTGVFELWRWSVALAALGMVVVPAKMQNLRALARANPYQSIRSSDRRLRGVAEFPPVMPHAAATRSAVAALPEPVVTGMRPARPARARTPR